MIHITLSFDPGQLGRFIFATHKVYNAVKLYSEDMAKLCAFDLRDLLISNIEGQQHMSSYSPLSKRYLEWKMEHGGFGSDFWKLYGALLTNITAFRSKGGWIGGVPAGVMGTGETSMLGKVGKRKPIALYSWWGEYGRKGQPARPIFGPTQDEYEKDGFIKRGEEALRKVGNHWS